MEHPISSECEVSGPVPNFENHSEPSHLKEGILPIMACIGDMEEPEQTRDIREGKTMTVGFGYDKELLGQLDIKNGGEDTYVISPIDGRSKHSSAYYNCTGLVVSGMEKETHKEISFLSHQNPVKFLAEAKSLFISDLESSMEEIKKRCEEGTIDAVIFGGNYFPISTYGNKVEVDNQEYVQSIELLDQETSKVLGFSPLVMTGPKDTPDGESVIYDTDKRRLFMFKPYDSDTKNFGSYYPKDIDSETPKWNDESHLE